MMKASVLGKQQYQISSQSIISSTSNSGFSVQTSAMSVQLSVTQIRKVSLIFKTERAASVLDTKYNNNQTYLSRFHLPLFLLKKNQNQELSIIKFRLSASLVLKLFRTMDLLLPDQLSIHALADHLTTQRQDGTGLVIGWVMNTAKL